MTKSMTGARMVVQALKDQGVEVVFGYPGGAVLPIYDEIFQQNDIRHILVRHEQGAVHAAEGYARSTGKPGVVLVTSGPGRHERGHGTGRRTDGFDPAGGPHRAGADLHDRNRRLPGGRHRRHHAALHEDELAREGHGAAVGHHPPGVPRRHERSARAGAGRHSEGRAVRNRGLRGPAGRADGALPAEGEGRSRADRAARRDDGDRRAPRVLHGRRRHQLRARGQQAPPRTR